jgi:acetyl esterase
MGDPSPSSRIKSVRRLLVLLAGVAIIPPAFLALGTFVPAIPYLGVAGPSLFPSYAGPLIVMSLAAAALAIAARRLGSLRAGSSLAVLGIATALAAGIIIGRHAQVAAANGATVNVFTTVIPRGVGAGASPDVTETFMKAGAQELYVDMYRPRGGSAALTPVAIYVHGGGWIRGERTRQAANLRWLADRGYLVRSEGYSRATPDRPTWNTATAEVACAFTWIAASAEKYGGDPKRLYVLGESAGGALALTTAYAAATGAAKSSCGGTIPAVRAIAVLVPAVDPVTFYDNPHPITGSIARRMVGTYLGGSPHDHVERVRAVSPSTYISPDAPPTLIMLSDSDHLVPIQGALNFVEHARHAGISIRVVRFPWADHAIALQYYNVVNQAWQQLMLQHFCRHGGECSGAPGQ